MHLNPVAGRVTLGEFDGKHPCIAAATTAEKVHTAYCTYRNGMIFFVKTKAFLAMAAYCSDWVIDILKMLKRSRYIDRFKFISRHRKRKKLIRLG